MTKPGWWNEANELYWLTDEEIELYGIDKEPDRRRDFLSVRAFHKKMIYDVNDKDQWVIIDNKWFFAKFCDGLGIPHPRVHGVLSSTHGLLVDGSSLKSVADLVSWCQRTGATRFVLKPLAGGDSQGIFVVERIEWAGDQPTFHVMGRGILSPQDLGDQLVTGVPWHKGASGVLLQDLAESNPWFAEHNFGPFNIVRIVTFVPSAGEPVAQSAALYCGRVGHPVNRFKDGAISVHVDLETGTLGTGRTLPKFSRNVLDSHPDTGSLFVGQALPDWQEAVDLALKASRMTIGMRLVCWEVLLSDRGPQLLEGNWSFGLTVVQVHGDGFLKNGIAEMWKQAGADLPDGTREWVKRTTPPLVTRALHKARRMLGSKLLSPDRG